MKRMVELQQQQEEECTQEEMVTRFERERSESIPTGTDRGQERRVGTSHHVNINRLIGCMSGFFILFTFQNKCVFNYYYYLEISSSHNLSLGLKGFLILICMLCIISNPHDNFNINSLFFLLLIYSYLFVIFIKTHF